MATHDREDSTVYKYSAGGLVIDQGKVLVLSWTDRDFICLPKGGIEEGESSEEAAVREVKEETGYNAKIIAPLGPWEYDFYEEEVRHHKTVDYYLMQLVDSEEPKPSRGESEAFVGIWLDIDDAYSAFTFDDAREALLQAERLLH